MYDEFRIEASKQNKWSYVRLPRLDEGSTRFVRLVKEVMVLLEFFIWHEGNGGWKGDQVLKWKVSERNAYATRQFDYINLISESLNKNEPNFFAVFNFFNRQTNTKFILKRNRKISLTQFLLLFRSRCCTVRQGIGGLRRTDVIRSCWLRRGSRNLILKRFERVLKMKKKKFKQLMIYRETKYNAWKYILKKTNNFHSNKNFTRENSARQHQ